MIVFSSKNYVFTKSKQPKSRSLKEKLKHEPDITFPTDRDKKLSHLYSNENIKEMPFFFFGTAKAKAREQKPRKAQVSSKH